MNEIDWEDYENKLCSSNSLPVRCRGPNAVYSIIMDWFILQGCVMVNSAHFEINLSPSNASGIIVQLPSFTTLSALVLSNAVGL